MNLGFRKWQQLGSKAPVGEENMGITLEITSEALSEEQLDGITRQLAQALEEETDLVPVLPAGNSDPGEKGEPVAIGALNLILTFISSGAAVALFEVLKAYFSREPSLKIDLKKPDGSELSLSAQNMDPDRVDETLGHLKRVLEG